MSRSSIKAKLSIIVIDWSIKLNDKIFYKLGWSDLSKRSFRSKWGDRSLTIDRYASSIWKLFDKHISQQQTNEMRFTT